MRPCAPCCVTHDSVDSLSLPKTRDWTSPARLPIIGRMRTLGPAGWLAFSLVALATTFPMGRTALSADDPPARRVAAGMERTGTVHAIDLEHRTIVLVAGVGYALRLERVEIPDGVAVRDRGTRAPLSVVTPGCIVRVGCHHQASEMVASTLELIERPAAASKP